MGVTEKYIRKIVYKLVVFFFVVRCYLVEFFNIYIKGRFRDYFILGFCGCLFFY